MKKIILLALLGILTHTAQAGWVKVTGVITNALAETVEVVRLTNFVNNQEKVYTAKLDANGAFSLDMEVFAPQYIQIKHSKYFKAGAYAAPGNDFHVTFDCVNFLKSIQYSGKGGADNNFMAYYFLKYEDTEAWNNYLLLCKSHDPATFRKAWEQQQVDEITDLNTYSESYEITSSFKSWMTDHITYKNANQMWDYQFNHAWENNMEVIDFQVPASFFTFFEDYKSSNDYLATSPHYNRFLTNFIWYLYGIDLEARGMVGFERFDIRMRKEIALTTKNLVGYARDKQYSAIMYELLEKGEKDLFEEQYAAYKSTVEDELLKFVVEVKANQVEARYRGEVMPQGAKEVIVVDNDGNMVPFKDVISLYAGKVVYIDFWASWCAPCIQEMPGSMKLQETFAGKDVAFIYLSQDTEEDRWRKAISKHDIKGDHILMNSQMQISLSNQFNINEIPRYVLIDKTGKVVNPDASSPSNPKTAEQIEALLNN